MVQRADDLPNWLRRRRLSAQAKRLIAAAIQRRRSVQEPAARPVAGREPAIIIPFPPR